MTGTIRQEHLYGLEISEAVYWSRYYEQSEPIQTYSSIIDGALACAVPEMDILALNRVIGLGIYHKITPGLLDMVTHFFRKAGSSRYFIQLNPYVVDEPTKAALQEAGFRHHNNWAKLVRPVNMPAPQVDSDLRVRRLLIKDAELYARIIFSSFDWEDERMIPWLAGTVGKPWYKHYIAYQGDTPVAVAAYHEHGEYASMAFAATLPKFRGLGAQKLLLKTRIEEAQSAGCRYLVSETGEDTTERPNQSYRNMIRAGFELAYLRQNWIKEL